MVKRYAKQNRVSIGMESKKRIFMACIRVTRFKKCTMRIKRSVVKKNKSIRTWRKLTDDVSDLHYIHRSRPLGPRKNFHLSISATVIPIPMSIIERLEIKYICVYVCVCALCRAGVRGGAKRGFFQGLGLKIFIEKYLVWKSLKIKREMCEFLEKLVGV